MSTVQQAVSMARVALSDWLSAAFRMILCTSGMTEPRTVTLLTSTIQNCPEA